MYHKLSELSKRQTVTKNNPKKKKMLYNLHKLNSFPSTGGLELPTSSKIVKPRPSELLFSVSPSLPSFHVISPVCLLLFAQSDGSPALGSPYLPPHQCIKAPT